MEPIYFSELNFLIVIKSKKKINLTLNLTLKSNCCENSKFDIFKTPALEYKIQSIIHRDCWLSSRNVFITRYLTGELLNTNVANNLFFPRRNFSLFGRFLKTKDFAGCVTEDFNHFAGCVTEFWNTMKGANKSKPQAKNQNVNKAANSRPIQEKEKPAPDAKRNLWSDEDYATGFTDSKKKGWHEPLQTLHRKSRFEKWTKMWRKVKKPKKSR